MENNKPSKIEQLKSIWRNIRLLIKNNDIESIDNLIIECTDDFSALRMILDAIMPVSEEELFIPLKNKLIQLIENKIGKKIY